MGSLCRSEPLNRSINRWTRSVRRPCVGDSAAHHFFFTTLQSNKQLFSGNEIEYAENSHCAGWLASKITSRNVCIALYVCLIYGVFSARIILERIAAAQCLLPCRYCGRNMLKIVGVKWTEHWKKETHLCAPSNWVLSVWTTYTCCKAYMKHIEWGFEVLVLKAW